MNEGSGSGYQLGSYMNFKKYLWGMGCSLARSHEHSSASAGNIALPVLAQSTHITYGARRTIEASI